MTQPSAPSAFTKLEEYRLAHDWTWAELATAMARVHIQMSPRTLHYLVKSAPADAKPHDRTIYKIRAFLDEARSNRAAHSRECKCRVASRRKSTAA